MVKVGRRFFFNQTFQKKQRRVTIITIVCVVVAIITTFGITSYFHDNSNEKAKVSYTLKEKLDVEVFTKMPSFLNYFSKLENVPLNKVTIEFDEHFTYDENGDDCSDEELELIKSIRNGHEKAKDGTDPFACLSFVPNQVGSFNVKVVVDKEENNFQLNVIDKTPPVFEAHDVTISNEETYSPTSFVSSCEDNSKGDCSFDFYVPLRGEMIDYSKYQDPGEYEIKLVAKDASGNASEPKTVKLTITKVNYYKITFNSNGGSAVEAQTVREGEKIYSPYSQKDGYSFEGWYNGNSQFNFENPINSDLNLTAKWKKNSTGSGGSGGGNGYSSGGGGSSSKKTNCQYGGYSDYSSSVSIYATKLNGKSLNDCADKINQEDYNELKSIVRDIAYSLTTRNEGAIDKEIQSLVGSNVMISHNIHFTQVINDKDGFVGVLVEIDSSVNGQLYDTYTLYDCTLSSCKWK